MIKSYCQLHKTDNYNSDKEEKMLKQDLNSKFTKQGINPQSVGEVDLFRALIKVMNNRNFAYAKEYHHSKGYVEHSMQFPHTPPHDRCCEIADVLMLFIDDNGEMRYTFMQNKRDNKLAYQHSSPLKKTKATPIQWDLLHHRCYLSNTLNTGLPPYCLSSAILPSAATYGIFVNEKYTGEVEMSYNIAANLQPCSMKRIHKPNNRQYNITTTYNHVNFVNGYWEVNGTARLDDFEVMAQAMLVGSPFLQNNPKHIELVKIFLSFINSCILSNKHDENLVDTEIYVQTMSLIQRCANNYNVEIVENIDLPFSLVVVGTKPTYFATTRESQFAELRSHIKCIFDRDKIYEKLQDPNSIVFVDRQIIDEKIMLQFSTLSENNYVASTYNKCFEFNKVPIIL